MVAERFIAELQVPSEMFVSVIVVLAVTPEMVTVAEPPVKVTVFVPMLAHVNEVTSKLNDTDEQLSVLPLSISAVAL